MNLEENLNYLLLNLYRTYGLILDLVFSSASSFLSILAPASVEFSFIHLAGLLGDE